MSGATSLRQRYDAFRVREVEFYKQVVSHATLMRLADVARERMYAGGSLRLGDLTLAYEVDDVIAERLRLPSFRTWSTRELRAAGPRRTWSHRAQQLTLRIPEGVGADVVLLIQPRAADLWEALCASGRRVLVVEPESDDRERILEQADRSGWSASLAAVASHEAAAAVDRFSSVFFSPAALADYAPWEAEELIKSLKSRTAAGGVHVIDGLVCERVALPRTMLRHSYGDWARRVVHGSRDWTMVATRATSSGAVA